MLFISINSLGEQTGGGIYARTLYRGLKSLGPVSVIAKRSESSTATDGVDHIELRKGPLQDLLARVLLCPAFTGYYLLSLLWHIRRHEVVVFHNSRQGGILALARVLFPRKTLVMCFDNVEQNLLKSYRSSGLVKRIMDRVDGWLTPFIERLAYRHANACTFITETDRQFFLQLYGENKQPSLVIPVSLPDSPFPDDIKFYDKPLIVLFTASFQFPPNIAAIHEIAELARLAGTGFEFHLAGKGLHRITNSKLKNIRNLHFFSDPDSKHMTQIFREADIYIAPVRDGSGMKTKVAEALSHALPVLATDHALNGYESVATEKFIVRYKNNSDALSKLHKLSRCTSSKREILRKEAHAAFTAYYAQSSLELKFRKLASLWANHH